METIEAAELRALVTVVRAGSFTRAAALLETRTSHVSRVVSRLEARLGARLLHRTTRSLGLTEIGREVFERAVGILGAMTDAVRAVQKAHEAPSGTLRLTCGVEFGLLAVNDWISAYLMRYPALRVDADFTNRVVDVVHEGFDVAIRTGVLEDSGLAARKLGEVTYGLFATPGYLAARGAPRGPDDLAKHALVLSTQTRQRRGVWELVRGADRRAVEVQPRLLVNTHMAVRDAALRGLGIALLPVFQAAPFVAEGALRPVLDGWGRTPVPVHAVFPSHSFLAPKVRAFIDEAAAGFARVMTASAPRGGKATARRAGRGGKQGP